MRFKRRGFRRGTSLKPRGNFLLENEIFKKTPPISWEEFYDKMMPMLYPGWAGDATGFSELYQGITQDDQKKLTHKIAGQILFAHPDVVRAVLSRLTEISLDLSQQTEVEYRRIQLIDRYF